MPAIALFALKNWKLIVGGVALAVLGVMLLLARSDARHWRKVDEAHVAALNLEIAKNAINLASIDQLTGIIDAKNAETTARAKAYADSKAADAANIARLDKQYAATDAARARLEDIARVPGGSEACRAPAALVNALEAL